MVTPKSPFPTTNAAQTPSQTPPSNAAPTPTTPFGRPGGDDDFVIDMSGVDLSTGMIQEGRHLAFISDLQKETSKAGNPMLVWSVTMYDGPSAGKTGKVYTALSSNAMWKVFEVCEAIGFDMPDNRQFKLRDLKEHALRTMVTADVVASEYNNRPSTSIAALFRPENIDPGTKLPTAGVPR